MSLLRSWSRSLRKPEWGALTVFAIFTLAAVAGYATFGLHPQLLPADGFARALYPVSFRLFAQVQIVLAAAALFVALAWRSGAAWIPALLAVAVVSFLAEHMGTGYGIPFGGYRYTGLLGPKIGGRVPALIPLSWFVMAVPSWALARSLLGRRRGRLPRFLLAAGFLVAWDAALDPAMSFLTPYWIWEETGPYYGMPWSNVAGWLVTGLVIMAVLETLGAPRWAPRISARWHAAFYGTVILMPLGMLLAAGAWTGVAVTAGAVGACVAAGALLGRPTAAAAPAPSLSSCSGVS